MNKPKLTSILAGMLALGISAQAAAKDPHPATLGCPADFAAVTKMIKSMKLSDKAPWGLYAWEYLGKVNVLGLQSDSIRLGATVPAIVGFRLPPAYKDALAQRKFACNSGNCSAWANDASEGAVAKATIEPQKDGSWDLQCHYMSFSLGELGDVKRPGR